MGSYPGALHRSSSAAAVTEGLDEDDQFLNSARGEEGEPDWQRAADLSVHYANLVRTASPTPLLCGPEKTRLRPKNARHDPSGPSPSKLAGTRAYGPVLKRLDGRRRAIREYRGSAHHQAENSGESGGGIQADSSSCPPLSSIFHQPEAAFAALDSAPAAS